MRDDDQLSDYRSKRDFEKTPEPEDAGRGGSDGPIFVIQEHAASTHHWDFRIEIDGALTSWSVPKGPSTDPDVKRLAIATEEHPLGYADFEGVIPEDEYGGGAVLVWDRGRYRNLRADKEGDGASMPEAFEEGKLEVWLEGSKIEGGHALIRTDDDRWLLIKMDDEAADARRNPTSTEPESVLSGREIDEVADEEGEGG